jgi:1,4-dihydroxy-6-naphthoate synthase
LPLGLIAAHRELGVQTVQAIEQAISESVRYAFAHPEASADYVREHAQEMSPEVCKQHIGLYVNQHSIEIGDEGRKAVDLLISRGVEIGLLPKPRRSPWIE